MERLAAWRPSPRPVAKDAGARSATSARRRSVDVLRGASVALMILVNNQGSGAHPFPGLAHAPWNGLTPADVVFPTFLVVVGVSMALAFARATATGVGRGRLLAGAACRAAVLVLLGLGLHALPRPDFAELRYPGVLQRIGVAYMLAAVVALWLRPRAQVLVAGAILLGYWLLIALVPVPGLGSPALTSTASVPGWLDRALFGARHVYRNGGYDPEGLLGTVAAVVSVLAGYWAGRWLRPRAPRPAAAGLARAGTVAVVAGLAWSVVLPLNKRLWTSSYVLVTAGIALLALAACVELVDGRRWHRLAGAFEPLGRNAIAVYAGAEELGYVLRRVRLPWTGNDTLRVALYGRVFSPLFGATLGSLAYGLSVLSVWWMVAVILHRRRWYVSV